jgi:ketosteroid isomerase-like protein
MLRTEDGCRLATGQYLADRLRPDARGSGAEVGYGRPGTMRLMFDTMDAYDRADFDRLAEIYAEDAQWRNADPEGPHCHNRDDIFAMFRQRMDSRVRVGFDELRSTPTQVLVTARAADFGAVVSVFSFQGTPHRRRQGLPVHGGRRGSARGPKPGAC